MPFLLGEVEPEATANSKIIIGCCFLKKSDWGRKPRSIEFFPQIISLNPKFLSGNPVFSSVQLGIENNINSEPHILQGIKLPSTAGI